MPATNSTKHVVELQSLRGIAALIVLFHHCSFYYVYNVHLKSLSEFFLNAHAAVVVFYVLSGYVLAKSLSQKPLNVPSVIKFYMRRVFRIYPALFAACTIGLAYVLVFHGRPIPAMVSTWWNPYYRNAPANLLKVTAAFLGNGESLPIPMWSIFVELIGSAILPIIVFTIRRDALSFVILTGVLLLLSLTVGQNTRMHFGEYLVNFAFGASILLWRDRLSIFLRSHRAAGILAVSSLVATILIRQVGGWNFQDFYHAPIPTIMEGLSGMVLIATIAARPSAFSILRLPVIVWYGDISYSLYLFHIPVLAFVAATGGEVLQFSLFTGNAIVATLTLMISTLAISTLLAAVSYRYIELPGIAFGAKAAGAMFKTAESPIAA